MTGYELFFISGSPPCWSVMLAMEMKGLGYEPKPLSNSKQEQKSADYLKINPRGQVPVLKAGDLVVCETLAILAYLETAYPKTPIFGRDPRETASIWQTLSEFDAALREPVGALSRPLFRGRAQDASEQIAAQAEVIHRELVLLESRLAMGAFLAGDDLSAADLIVFPILKQLERAVSREDARDLGLFALVENYPAIIDWAGRIEKIPGYERAYPPHWR